jgi:uncharacterized protein YjbJ (UPF0337 family)
MNDSTVKGKWTEFKGEVQQLWGKATGDDLDRTEGNVTAIAGIIQQKYGELKDEARQQFDALVAKYSDKTADKSEEVKTDLQADRDQQKDLH